MQISEVHFKYCQTEPQREAVAAMINAGCNATAAARHLKIDRSSLKSRLRHILRREAAHDPMVHAEHAAEGYPLVGVSTCRRVEMPDGSHAMQWVKTKRDAQEALDSLRVEVEEILEGARGAIEPATPPEFTMADLLAVYPLGDAHLGMLTSAAECGDSYDLKIAEREIYDVIDRAVVSALPARFALILGMGDWWHADSNENKTARAGNILDVDSRYAKRAGVGLRLLRRLTDRVVRKHEQTTEIILPGNHDEHTAVMAQIAMTMLYENEPRLTIDQSVRAYRRFIHGECFIGAAHGHLSRDLKRVVLAFGDDYKKQGWDSTHRHIYLGHDHHAQAEEIGGVRVEKVQALCPKDAWAAGAAYRAGRGQQVDFWHVTKGRIASHFHQVGAA